MADQEQGTTAAAPAPATAQPVNVINTNFSPLVIVMLASVVEFIAAARFCDLLPECEEENGYAVAVGVIGFVVSLTFIIVLRLSQAVNNIITQVVAVFLLAWWSAGAGVLTFRGPFVFASNGYFASWLAFGAAGYFAFHSVPMVHWAIEKLAPGQALDHKVLWTVLVASVIEIAAAGVNCDNLGDNCKDEHAWAVAVGAISIVMAAVGMFAPLGKFKMYFAIALAVLWAFGAGVLTFENPFLFPNNGYFSSWVAFFASNLWAYLCAAEQYPSLRRTAA